MLARGSHLPDELHAVEIVEVIGVDLDSNVVVDGRGQDRGVIDQLRRAPHKGNKLIVIEAPAAVRPSRLEPVRQLYG